MNTTHSRSDDASKRRAGAAGSYLWLAACCGLLTLASLWAGRELFAIPEDYFLPVHLILEFASIVISFAVFTVGWYGFRQSSNVRDLLIGVTFLTAGTIDFVHTLSYKGMPEFLGANSPGKAAAYWMLARLLIAVGLLAASFVGQKSRSWLLTARGLTGLAVAVVAAAVILVTALSPGSGDIFFDPVAHELAPLKIVVEYVIIGLYVAGIAMISQRRGWEPATVRPLRNALVFAAFGELCFTMYASPYAPVNALGHLFKMAAYYLILRALFVTAVQKPYQELAVAKESLQELYADAQEHRKEIERSFGRIGSALSSGIQLDEALNRVAELAADMLHADCAIVASTDPSGEITKVAAEHGACHSIELTVQLGKRTLDHGTTVIINDLDQSGIAPAVTDSSGHLRSAICTIMRHEGTILGVICIYSHKPSAFDDGDVKLLEGFALHAAIAAHNAMSYERESRIADVLQRAILTPSKVATERFEIAEVYKPAASEALVGGDFYDAVELQGGRVGLAIGDVSGKGLKAAVHTAMVKYTLRAYESEGHSPGAILRLLNDAMSRTLESDAFVTMFLGVLDTNTGELVYANAGHEPPIYAHNGEHRLLEVTGAALGIIRGEEYGEASIRMEKGSLLLLYTDGISEARQGRKLLGTERVAEEVLVCHDTSPGNVAMCVHQAALAFAGGELLDDAAIMAVKAL